MGTMPVYSILVEMHFLSPFLFMSSNLSNCFRNNATTFNHHLVNHGKYMCIHSANASQKDKSISKTPENIREIPLRVESQENVSGFSHHKENIKGKTTLSAEEVNKFRLLAGSWWDTHREFKPLHSLNKLRIALVRDGLIQSGVVLSEHVNGPQPLKGLRILDVGCGGGILCEPLARLGAHVVGLDAAQENLAVASVHAQKDKQVAANVEYVHSTIEDHAKGDHTPYDAVVASEVLEHVASVDLFVETCVSVIKPGGSLFLTTINKTTRSWLAAIIMAEYVLGLLPQGTHNWEKFVPHQDLLFLLEKTGCSTSLIHGMLYLPIWNKWIWVADSSVNYAVHAIKKRMDNPPKGSF